MFIHVPSAWLAMMGYGIVAASSFGLLVFRHPLADVSAKAAAPIGAVFTLLALITGSLWGKPMWGTYWVWDARLTSVLILFFLYLGLIALRQSIEDEADAAQLTAILAIAGVVILPIIKFSVNWWWTMHQPSTQMTSTVHLSMRIPLLIMAAGFTLLFLAMHMTAMRNEILRQRVKVLRMLEVTRAEGGRAETERHGQSRQHPSPTRDGPHEPGATRRLHLEFLCRRGAGHGGLVGVVVCRRPQAKEGARRFRGPRRAAAIR